MTTRLEGKVAAFCRPTRGRARAQPATTRRRTKGARDRLLWREVLARDSLLNILVASFTWISRQGEWNGEKYKEEA